MMPGVVAAKREWWIPFYFVAFFVAIAVLDGIFVYLAVSTQSGVVTDQAYEKGLAFNQTLSAAQSARDLGITPVFKIQGQELTWKLTDRHGGPATGAAVTARLVRPVQEGYDQTYTLSEVEPGLYQARIAPPLPGAWDIYLKATWLEQKSLGAVEHWYNDKSNNIHGRE